MNQSMLDRPAGADESDPRCVLVAGASGGIGAAFCAQIARSFPNALAIRMARNPAALAPLTAASVDIRLDITEEQQIRDAGSREDTRSVYRRERAPVAELLGGAVGRGLRVRGSSPFTTIPPFGS